MVQLVTGLPDAALLAYEAKIEAAMVTALQDVADVIADRIAAIQIAAGRIVWDGCPHGWHRSHTGPCDALTAADEPPSPGPPGQPYVSPDDLASITPLWDQAVATSLMPVVAEVWQQSSGQVYAQMVDASGIATIPTVSSIAAEQYLAAASNTFKEVGGDLWETARNQLLDGFQQGESIPELAQRVRGSAGLTAKTATLVARTQVLDASNAGSIATARASGLALRKMWFSTPDLRTRPDHMQAGHTYGSESGAIPLADKFMVGGFACDRPHDPALPPELRYNCRCAVGYTVSQQSKTPVVAEQEPPLPGQSGGVEALAAQQAAERERVFAEVQQRVAELGIPPVRPPGRIPARIPRAIAQPALTPAEFEARLATAATSDDALRAAAVALRSAAERKAYADYVAQFRFINTALRENAGVIPAGREFALERRLQTGLDSAMKRASTTDDMLVYRLAGTREFEGGIPRVGAEFTDQGYLSTSTRPKVDIRPGEVSMRILVPKGSKAVATPELDVNEVLLNRGGRYRVVRAEQDARGIWRVDVEVVPPPPAEIPLARHPVAELRSLAKERSIVIPAGAKKADIVRLLEAPPPAAVPSGVEVAGRVPVQVRAALLRPKTLPGVQEAWRAEMRRITGRDIPVVIPDGVSRLTAREYAEGVLRGLERFPDAGLTMVEFVPGLTADEYAHAVGGVIRFNARLANPANRQLLLSSLRGDVAKWDDELIGWSTRGDGSAMSVGIHEFGHIVDLDTLGGRIHTEALLRMDTLARLDGVSTDTFVAREISAYSGSDEAEMVAEAFADVLLRGDAASIASRRIFEVLEREYLAGGKRVGVSPVVGRAASETRMSTAEFDARAAQAASGEDALRAASVKIEETKAQQEAIGRYGTNDANAINSELRRSAGDLAELSVADRVTVEHLDSVMARSQLREDVITYRHIADVEDVLPEIHPDSDLTGLSWIEQAFVSTSKSDRGVSRGRNMKMRILSPPGTPAISHGFLDSDEVLLGRGLRFRIVKDHGLDEFGVRRVDVQVIPEIRVGITPGVIGRAKAAPKPLLSEVKTSLSAEDQARVRRLTARDPQIFATVQDRLGPISTSGNLSAADAAWLQRIYERDRAFVERAVQEASIKREIAAAAKKAGQTPTEYRTAVAARLRELLADKPIAVRIRDEAALRDVLTGGRFKTQLEGAKRAAGLASNPSRRILAEEIQGIPADVAAAERPVYGYVAINDIEPALAAGRRIPGIRELEGQEDVLSSYGRITIVLRSEVRARTTATVGDSLDEVGFLRPSPVDAPTAESLGFRKLDDVVRPDFTRRGYIEAQIQGGVRADDIAFVVFPEAPDQATIAALAQRQIPWRVLKKGDTPLRLSDVALAERAAPPAAEIPLARRPITALRALAKERGVPIPAGAKKADIVSLLEGKAPTPTVVPLAKRSVAELRTLAVQRDIPLPPKVTKAELVRRLQLPEAEIKQLRQQALREAARVKAAQIEQASGNAKLLAEMDRLLSTNAETRVIRQALDRKLIGRESLYAGADPAVLDGLAAVADDPVKLRAAITRLGTKAKVKPISRAGAKVAFDPATMEGVGGEIKAGTQVTVVSRGASVTLPDKTVVQLAKAKVTPVVTKPAAKPVSADLRTAKGIRAAHTVKDEQTGLTSEVEHIGRVDVDTYGDQFDGWKQVDLSIGNEDVQGFATVFISPDRTSVYYAALVVPDELQAQGAVTRLIGGMLEKYKAAGVKELGIRANANVGGYAWARAGFQFYDEQARLEFARYARDYAAGHRVERYGEHYMLGPAKFATKVDAKTREAIFRVAGNPDAQPADYAAIGWTQGAKDWPGKRFMLGSFWRGKMQL